MITTASKLEEHKNTVLAFFEAALNNKDFDAASEFIGHTYVQHNPRIRDGIEGLRAFVEFIKTEFPALRAPGQAGSAIVDIFRFDDGKIVEHWDVMQPMPETSENPNGMF